MSFAWQPRRSIRAATLAPKVMRPEKPVVRPNVLRPPTPVPPGVAAVVAAAVIREVDANCKRNAIDLDKKSPPPQSPPPTPPDLVLTASEPDSDDDDPVVIYDPPMEEWTGWRLPWGV